MRITSPALRRRAVAGWFALAGLFLVASPARSATPIERILPDSTLAVVQIKDARALREALGRSQFGRLWNDPALKAYRDQLLLDAFDEAGKDLKETLGVDVPGLFELFQGPAALALVSCKDHDAVLTFSAVATMDAGLNAPAVDDILTRFTRAAERYGSKVSTESFRGVAIHRIPIDDDEPVKEPEKTRNKNKNKNKARDEDEDDDDEDDDVAVPPIIWARQESVFYLGTCLETVKDLIAHADGRGDALATSEPYTEAVKKLGADLPVFAFIDLRKLGVLLLQDLSTDDGALAVDPDELRKFLGVFQHTGLGSLKAAAASLALGEGNCDSIVKTVIQFQGPAQGLLKVFNLPRVSLQPEPWVPANVATYQSISWDLDHAYAALNELANRVAPGLLEFIQQQFVDPEGGDPLRFKQDIFDPLGDRITIISDFKKPIRGDTTAKRLAAYLSSAHTAGVKFGGGDDARTLLAVSLEDSQSFQNTLSKLIGLAGLQPQRREFRGTIIHDFEVPAIPLSGKDREPKEPRSVQLIRGPMSVAIANETLFIATEPALLEQVLRGGGPSLAESDAYRSFARELPSRVSSVYYIRPEEQARLTYALFKNGQIETGLQGGAFGVGVDLSVLTSDLDKGKLPEFSLFTKYATPAGRYSESSEDGFSMTTIVLRKKKE
jgi:hypothetical protein